MLRKTVWMGSYRTNDSPICAPVAMILHDSARRRIDFDLSISNF